MAKVVAWILFSVAVLGSGKPVVNAAVPALAGQRCQTDVNSRSTLLGSGGPVVIAAVPALAVKDVKRA